MTAILEKAAEVARQAKNTTIAQSRAATREKRRNQEARIIDLKILQRKLNSKQKYGLPRVFLEAKWGRNEALGSENPLQHTLSRTVQVKTPAGFEEREFRHLGSSMRQAVMAQLASDARALKAKKDKGGKVGRLKFVSEVNSIDLKQYGNTHAVDLKRSKIRVQGLGWMQVRGIDQLKKRAWEFANAKLVQRADGHHLLLTCYYDKELLAQERAAQLAASRVKRGLPITPLPIIGTDHGLKVQETTSQGQEVTAMVEETERHKHYQREMSRRVKGSNSYRDSLHHLRREQLKEKNRRDDLAKKFVYDLLCQAEVIVHQDDCFRAWAKRNGYVKGGRKIAHSIIGRVKALLQSLDNTVMLGRFEATSQLCWCGVKTKHHLWERTFTCGACGYSCPRDLHAARIMVFLAVKQGAAAERSEELADMLEYWRASGHVQSPSNSPRE